MTILHSTRDIKLSSGFSTDVKYSNSLGQKFILFRFLVKCVSGTVLNDHRALTETGMRFSSIVTISASTFSPLSVTLRSPGPDPYNPGK